MRKGIYLGCGGIVAILLFSFFGNKKVVTANYDVIPHPQEIVLVNEKPFILSSSVQIVYPKDNQKMKENAGFLSTFIQEAVGYVPALTSDGKVKKGIFLELDPSISQEEGYEIVTNRNSVHIKAGTEAGIFYGIQTLRKALPVMKGAEVKLPAGTVEDYPRFKYRGALLDVGRHYFPVAYVKQFIDMLALHNINYFHWHLTEDQGWRIEIKKYPLLTEIGSKRKGTIIDWESKEFDNISYGGFYTQEEAREVVAYAAARHITVIPEIDLPGHMLAALASYPELGCTGGPYEVSGNFGVFGDVLCAGNPKSLPFVKDVIAEVMEIFPSPYIHIGGDECPKERWKKCPQCQNVIKQLGLDARNPEERLQAYFMKQIAEFITSKGRHMIGWDEILEGGATQEATIMAWNGDGRAITAVRRQHDVITTPFSYLYLSNQGYIKWKGLENVKRIYDFEPVPKTLTPDEQKFIIGAQVCTWTEWIADSSRLEYIVLPRLAAAAELFWTQSGKKDYDSFMKRLPHMLHIYFAKGYEYRKDIWNPCLQIKTGKNGESAEISCQTMDAASVYYTTDGTLPDKHSLKYEHPFPITKNTVVKAIAVRNDGNSEVDSVRFH